MRYLFIIFVLLVISSLIFIKFYKIPEYSGIKIIPSTILRNSINNAKDEYRINRINKKFKNATKALKIKFKQTEITIEDSNEIKKISNKIIQTYTNDAKRENKFQSDSNISKLKETKPIIKHKSRKAKCNDQWINVNKYLYFRNQLSFYFSDEKRIEIYYLKHSSYKPKLKLQLAIDDKSYQIKIISLNNIKTYSNFNFEVLIAHINFKNITSQNKIDANIKVDSYSVTIPNIQVKSKIKSNKSLLCSKLYFFGNDKALAFEWWIEMAKINGFDKLVFFNNSLTDQFDFLAEKYSNFIEIIQFTCIPNFIDPNNKKIKFFYDFNEIRKIYNHDPLGYHVLFEHITQNECYLTNRNSYKYIAVLDQDEMIFQNSLDNKCPVENFTMKNYLDTTLKSYIAAGVNATYHFQMGIYLDEKLANQFFNKLRESLNLFKTMKKFTLNIEFDPSYKPTLNITISNEAEYNYAKKLFDKYENIVLGANPQRFKIPEMFNRFFYIDEDTTNWMCGKTIHNTDNTHRVSTHYPITHKNFRMVNFKYGHVAHFKDYFIHLLKKISLRSVPIFSVKFDYFYFKCIFNPIFKILYSK